MDFVKVGDMIIGKVYKISSTEWTDDRHWLLKHTCESNIPFAIWCKNTMTIQTGISLGFNYDNFGLCLRIEEVDQQTSNWFKRCEILERIVPQVKIRLRVEQEFGFY